MCPRCETAIAKWDYQAPIDYYRCYVCGLATAFIDLPKRDLLRTWSRGPVSIRIPRGTGGTVTDGGGFTMTIPSVTCGGGSLLVVGIEGNNGADPTVGDDFTVTWGTQSLSRAVMFVNAAGSHNAAIYYGIAQSGGTNDVTVSSFLSSAPWLQEMGAWASEVTVPISGVPLSTSSKETSSGFDSLPPLAIGGAVFACGYPSFVRVLGGELTDVYDPPMQLGQSSLQPIGVVKEAFLMPSCPDGFVISGNGFQSGSVHVAATFRVSQ